MMRVLVVNVCVLVMAVTLIQAQEQPESTPEQRREEPESCAKPHVCTITTNSRSTSSCYVECHGSEVLGLMKEHLQFSMNYLLTSKQYGSQYVQHPGMAKFLLEASDRHWEEGMDVLKKYLQRGGKVPSTVPDFKGNFVFAGNPQLQMSGTDETIKDKYVDYLQTMLDNSKQLSKFMNRLYRKAGKNFDQGGDAEFAHYFSDKSKNEAKITRELAGHINTFTKMKDLGLALTTFDSHL
ncbi:hypothetical protein SK128_007886 [Halocaridina rubra]|uniref:Ferritin/DPS domain-containing protein n=1 Tax=Halocaridina rubra TaxID=373956 RepID=A0AAN8WJL2_HALRR